MLSLRPYLKEELPQDRNRFKKYMSSRPLGLGIITAVSIAPIPENVPFVILHC